MKEPIPCNGGHIIRREGFTWVRPQSTWCDNKFQPYPGAVAIQTNAGWLLLARVERTVSEEGYGNIRHILVSLDELPTEYVQPHPSSSDEACKF